MGDAVTPETDSMPRAAGHSGRGAARARWLAWALLALAALGLLVGASVGSTGLGSVFNARHDPVAWQIVMDIRLPRTLGAWLAGALLGLAGAVSQGLFRNPLADPYLLGSASGAALGGAVALKIARAVLAAPHIGKVGFGLDNDRHSLPRRLAGC